MRQPSIIRRFNTTRDANIQCPRNANRSLRSTPLSETCRLTKQKNPVGKFFKSLRGKHFGQNPKRFFVIRIARETDSIIERRLQMKTVESWKWEVQGERMKDETGAPFFVRPQSEPCQSCPV